jgi:hypothetical protein
MFLSGGRSVLVWSAVLFPYGILCFSFWGRCAFFGVLCYSTALEWDLGPLFEGSSPNRLMKNGSHLQRCSASCPVLLDRVRVAGRLASFIFRRAAHRDRSQDSWIADFETEA